MWGIHKRDFAAMLKAIPVLETKLIAIMVDRVREITRLDLREEKLMSLSYNIIKRHKGTLGVRSEPGRTVFEVRLPIADV
jgi:hypothetical protein